MNVIAPCVLIFILYEKGNSCLNSSNFVNTRSLILRLFSKRLTHTHTRQTCLPISDIRIIRYFSLGAQFLKYSCITTADYPKCRKWLGVYLTSCIQKRFSNDPAKNGSTCKSKIPNYNERSSEIIIINCPVETSADASRSRMRLTSDIGS